MHYSHTKRLLSEASAFLEHAIPSIDCIDELLSLITLASCVLKEPSFGNQGFLLETKTPEKVTGVRHPTTLASTQTCDESSF